MGSDDPSNVTFPHGTVTIDPSNHEIIGSNAERQDFIIGPNPAPNFHAYFVARFSEPVVGWGTASVGDGTTQPNETSAAGRQISGYVRFAEGVRIVDVRIGVSFISVDQARKNLESEIPDGASLEETARNTRAAWAEKLDRIQVEGASDTQKTVFYTGVFHSLQVSLSSLKFEPVLDLAAVSIRAERGRPVLLGL